jgi:CHAT domain-containing protein
MKPCPPPSGSRLPDEQRAFLFQLLDILKQNDYSQKKLGPSLPEIVRSFSEICSTEDDLAAWCDELQQWVRWRRVKAYWLAYILQLLTKDRNSAYGFLACAIYSDAQVNFAHDLALSSIETAYVAYCRNRSRLGPAFESVGSALEQRLRLHHEYYVSWSRPFAYIEANPCADNIYVTLSRFSLLEAAREDDPTFKITDANALSRVIGRCDGDPHAYYRVLARRFLGFQHGGAGRIDLAATEYAAALEDALRLGLSTEIGHLRRLLGWALRKLGDAKGARHQLEEAYAYECRGPAQSLTMYWQALSKRELGDAIVDFAGRPVGDRSPSSAVTHVTFDDPERAFAPALDAYSIGRQRLDAHMTFDCPFPLARAAKQQIFRSFSENAIQVAYLLKSEKDLVAEVEWSGPREATEMVTEIAAAGKAGESLIDFRRNRALYYSTLNTLPERFEHYLADVVEHWAERHNYVVRSLRFDPKILVAQWSDNVAQKIAQLRIPDTVFLLFKVGQRETMMIMADISSGTVATVPIPVGEPRLREIHTDYATAIKDPAKRQDALDVLLARYAELFGPVLAPIIPFLPGKHLKIFPRLHMNAVPLHALRLEGKFLIEHCAAVSYGQTLGLFLQNHAARPALHRTAASGYGASSAAIRMVIGEDVPWYELLLPKVRTMYGDALVEDHQPVWDGFLRSLRARPTRDIVFACHGTYQPGNLEDSWLELSRHGSEGAVQFERIFAELDLQGCRSVMMGACESGLVRAEIGAEYLGLASAMLSSGVRYVIGALWEIPQEQTAALVHKYLELIKNPSTSVAAALCEAQRYVMTLTRDAFAGWVRDVVRPGPKLDELEKELATWDELPFAHSYDWAGLQAVGDV